MSYIDAFKELGSLVKEGQIDQIVLKGDKFEVKFSDEAESREFSNDKQGVFDFLDVHEDKFHK